MKLCKHCGINKEDKEFNRTKTTLSGLYWRCKTCVHNTRVKQVHSANYTRNDILSARWGGILSRLYSKGYANIEVRMTREEFISIMDNSDLQHLFTLWDKSGRSFRLTPSIDRINPDGHYEISNIRWLPLYQNSARGRRKGECNRRKIDQFTKSGEYITSFESASAASRTFGVSPTNITACARKEIPSAYGFRWRYSTH